MAEKSFIRKNWERACYLIFLILLHSLSAFAFIYFNLLRIFKANQKRSGVVFYPYSGINSIGGYLRVDQFEALLKRDNIPYKVCYCTEESADFDSVDLSWHMALLYQLKIYLIRIIQLKEVFAYDVVFIQRGMFPYFYELKKPLLERLIWSSNKNIVIDFWDSVFETQTELIKNTLQCAKTVTVSNEFLETKFSELHHDVVRWPIGINTSIYFPKQDYTLHDPIRIMWTGLPHNLPNLARVVPVLNKLAGVYSFVLVICGRDALTETSFPIEHHPWSPDTFYNLMEGADIGIYPEKESVHAKGKSAMKVMDFMSSALPVVGVPYGLPAEAKNRENMIIAVSDAEWEQGLLDLIKDAELRTKLGRNGRQMIEAHYSSEENYRQLKEILFGKN